MMNKQKIALISIMIFLGSVISVASGAIISNGGNWISFGDIYSTHQIYVNGTKLSDYIISIAPGGSVNGTSIDVINAYADLTNTSDLYVNDETWVDVGGTYFNRTDTLAYPESEASYTIWNNTITHIVYAKNEHTGQIDYSGTVAATVIQAAINAATSTGTKFGKVVIKGDINLGATITLRKYLSLEFDKITMTADVGAFTYTGAGNGLTDGIKIRGGNLLAGVAYTSLMMTFINASGLDVDIQILAGTALGSGRGIHLEGADGSCYYNKFRVGQIYNLNYGFYYRASGTGSVNVNKIYDSQLSSITQGVYYSQAGGAIAVNNNLCENVKIYATPNGGNGFLLQGATNVKGNVFIHCIVDDPANPASIGINLDVGATDNLWIGGLLNPTMVQSWGTGTIHFVNCQYYITENSGIGVNIALHATHAHVTHGLSYTPTAADIGITWTTSLTNCTSSSVTGISSSEFIVTLYDANGAEKGPSGTVTFSWKSIKTP